MRRLYAELKTGGPAPNGSEVAKRDLRYGYVRAAQVPNGCAGALRAQPMRSDKDIDRRLRLGCVKTQRRANRREKYFFGSPFWQRGEHSELRRRSI